MSTASTALIDSRLRLPPHPFFAMQQFTPEDPKTKDGQYLGPRKADQISLSQGDEGVILETKNPWLKVSVLQHPDDASTQPTVAEGWIHSRAVFTFTGHYDETLLRLGPPRYGSITEAHEPTQYSTGPPPQQQAATGSGTLVLVHEYHTVNSWAMVSLPNDLSVKGWIPARKVRLNWGRLGKPSDVGQPFIATGSFNPTNSPTYLSRYYHTATDNCPPPAEQAILRTNATFGHVRQVSNNGQWSLISIGRSKRQGWVPSNRIRIGYPVNTQGAVIGWNKLDFMCACTMAFNPGKYEDWPWIQRPLEEQIQLKVGDVAIVKEIDPNLAWVRVRTCEEPSQNGWVRSDRLGFTPSAIVQGQKLPGNQILNHLAITTKGFTAIQGRGVPPNDYNSFQSGEQAVVQKIQGNWILVNFYQRNDGSKAWVLANRLRPQNVPFQAIHEWYRQDENTKEFHLRKKEYGWAHRLRLDDNWVFVNRAHPPEGEERGAWVPADYVKLGGPHDYGKIRVQVQAPTVFSNASALAETVSTAGHGLRKHITGVLKAWRANIDQLGWWRPQFNALTQSDTALNAFVDEILLGIRNAGMLDILERNDFTFDELVSRGRHINPSLDNTHPSQQPGIYCIGYSNFPKERNKRRLYVGSSKRMGQRSYGHNNGWRNPQTSHHRTCAPAQSKKMFAICLLPNSTRRKRLVVEQLFVVLLQTFRPDIYSVHFTDASSQRNEVEAIDVTEAQAQAQVDEEAVPDEEDEEGDEEDEEEENVEHGDNGGGETAGNGRGQRPGTCSYVTARQAAFRLSTIANAALRKTGWKLGREWDGVNVRPPATEISFTDPEADKIWVKTQIADNFIQFRRTDVKLVRQTASDCFAIHATKSYPTRHGVFDSFDIYIPSVVNKNLGFDLEKVEKLHLVAELKLDGQHPRSWTRLPPLGAFDDWKLVTGLGIKLEFVHAGKWNQLYVQATNSTTTYATVQNDPINAGSFKVYATASSFVRYLLQRRCYNLPLWYGEYGTAVVKEQVFDPLSQVITIRDLRPQDWARPQRVAISDHGRKMIDLGAQNVNVPWGTVVPKGKVMGGKSRRRTACDSCAANGAYQSARKQEGLIYEYDLAAFGEVSGFGSRFLQPHGTQNFLCRQVPGTNQCFRCWTYGRPCSWTDTGDLVVLHDLQKAIMHQAFFEGTVPDVSEVPESDQDEASDDDGAAGGGQQTRPPPIPRMREIIPDPNIQSVVGIAAELV